jgi:uncharacterized membrane-anchored protein
VGDPRPAMLCKVPQVTVFFWIIKVLCTTVGETASAFLNVNLGLGLGATATSIAFLLAIVAVIVSLGLTRRDFIDEPTMQIAEDRARAPPEPAPGPTFG